MKPPPVKSDLDMFDANPTVRKPPPADVDSPHIVWEDPPPPSSRGGGRKGSVWVERLSPLTAHPGRWARVFETTPKSASGIPWSIQKKKVRVPPGRWEIVSRVIEGRGCIFARYLGPDE